MMRSFIILAAASVLAACSSLKPYPSVAPENVVVKSAIESGSVLSSMRGAVHIHEVDASCHTSYVGTVKLDRPSIALGFPAERPSYLVFVFQGSSLFGGSTSSAGAGTVLKPRPGYRYEFAVSYKDNIYNVVLRESDPRRGASREVPRQELRGCSA